MNKVESHAEVLSRHVQFSGKTVLDVGCGTGDLVRWMTRKGAFVMGIDTMEMITRAENFERSGNERYLVSSAQDLPFRSQYADIILYIASLHHVPEEEMKNALERCHRILKPGGAAVFVEPVAQQGSYYEIVRLEGDEAEIQAKAYDLLLRAEDFGFTMRTEEKYYLERSFDDYVRLLEVFVNDKVRRDDILAKAEVVTEQLCRESGARFEEYRYRSICRLNIMDKTVSTELR
jgi:ubiquinone/menaquinone biosynthesis C-methylase UbiE